MGHVRGVMFLVLLVTSGAVGCSASTMCALGVSCKATSSASAAPTDPPPPKIRSRDVGRFRYAGCVETADGSDCR